MSRAVPDRSGTHHPGLAPALRGRPLRIFAQAGTFSTFEPACGGIHTAADDGQLRCVRDLCRMHELRDPAGCHPSDGRCPVLGRLRQTPGAQKFGVADLAEEIRRLESRVAYVQKRSIVLENYVDGLKARVWDLEMDRYQASMGRPPAGTTKVYMATKGGKVHIQRTCSGNSCMSQYLVASDMLEDMMENDGELSCNLADSAKEFYVSDAFQSKFEPSTHPSLCAKCWKP